MIKKEIWSDRIIIFALSVLSYNLSYILFGLIFNHNNLDKELSSYLVFPEAIYIISIILFILVFIFRLRFLSLVLVEKNIVKVPIIDKKINKLFNFCTLTINVNDKVRKIKINCKYDKPEYIKYNYIEVYKYRNTVSPKLM